MKEQRESPVGRDHPSRMTENDLRAERDELDGLLRQGRLTPKEARRLSKIENALEELETTRGML